MSEPSRFDIVLAALVNKKVGRRKKAKLIPRDCRICQTTFEPWRQETECCSRQCAVKARKETFDDKFRDKRFFPCGHTTSSGNVYLWTGRLKSGRIMRTRRCRLCGIYRRRLDHKKRRNCALSIPA